MFVCYDNKHSDIKKDLVYLNDRLTVLGITIGLKNVPG